MIRISDTEDSSNFKDNISNHHIKMSNVSNMTTTTTTTTSTTSSNSNIKQHQQPQNSNIYKVPSPQPPTQSLNKLIHPILQKIVLLFYKQKDNENSITFREKINVIVNFILSQPQERQNEKLPIIDEYKLYDDLQSKLNNKADFDKLGDLYRELIHVSRVAINNILYLECLNYLFNPKSNAIDSLLEKYYQQQLHEYKLQQQQQNQQNQQIKKSDKQDIKKSEQTTTIATTIPLVDQIRNRIETISIETIVPKQKPPPIANEFLNTELPKVRSTTTTTTNIRNNKTTKTNPQQINTDRITVSDELLLKDLIYVFQGIDGKYIKYFRDINAYNIDKNVHISKPKKDLICRLVEFGWLFRQIRLFLANSQFTSQGLVNQCFCSCIQDELSEFYRLIAVLETKINRNASEDDESNNIEQFNEENDGSSTKNNNMTLMGMFVWIQKPLLKLKALAALVTGVSTLKGGATLSYIESFTVHGNLEIKEMVKSILIAVSQPIFTMLNRWIFEGEIYDTHGEFFIAKNQQIPVDRVWNDKYTFVPQMLPSFFNQSDMSRRILLIGKSINFMKQCCKEPSWSVDRPAIQLSSYADLANLEVIINKVSQHSSKRLIDLMMVKFRFMDHCNALRRYMLLGQGDFIQGLMDMLGEDLLKPVAQLTRHRLVSIMENAIRTSNSQFEDEDVLRRLDISLQDERSGAIGWDIFSLDYHIDMPLATIISKSDMMSYKRIFLFLWSVKRVEFSLSSTWRKTHSCFNTLLKLQALSKSGNFGQILQNSQMLAHEMSHFVSNFNYYVMFEVIESSWVKMVNSIEKSSDLDQLINAHTLYLEEISCKTFLINSESCYDSFKKLLAVISKFAFIQKSLCSLADAVKKEIKLTEQQIQRIEKELNSYANHLQSLYKDYRSNIKKLQDELLKIKNKNQDINPTSLLYMLDFNEYYSKTFNSRLSTSPPIPPNQNNTNNNNTNNNTINSTSTS